MITKSLTVVNPSGLHLRPAGLLSKEAVKYKCEIYIRSKGKTVTAKSVLKIMTAGIKCGEKIELVCDGEDEKEASEALTEAIMSGLGEEPVEGLE